MQVTESECRSILTRTSGYLGAVCSHSLNPYAGCGFGRASCGVGCYVRFNGWITRGREWGSFVDVKVNADAVYLETCARESGWARRRDNRFSIFLASATEPWQPVEKRYRITRRVLEAMLDQPPDELILQTHAVGIREDLDRVVRLSRKTDLRVHVSIEGDRDRLPGLPPPPASVAERVRLVRELADAGLRTVVCLSPLYPLQHPEAFFETLASAGASALVFDHFILGDGTPLGTRTLKTGLPEAMARVAPESVQLDYRDRMAALARRFLPIGFSAAGFAGEYFPVLEE